MYVQHVPWVWVILSFMSCIFLVLSEVYPDDLEDVSAFWQKHGNVRCRDFPFFPCQMPAFWLWLWASCLNTPFPLHTCNLELILTPALPPFASRLCPPRVTGCQWSPTQISLTSSHSHSPATVSTSCPCFTITFCEQLIPGWMGAAHPAAPASPLPQSSYWLVGIEARKPNPCGSLSPDSRNNHPRPASKEAKDSSAALFLCTHLFICCSPSPE